MTLILAKYRELLDIIKAALLNVDVPSIEVTDDIYQEFIRHAISALPAHMLKKLCMSSDLRKTWEITVLHHLAFNFHYRYQQSVLPINVPYVVIKGTSAAQYYPHPEYRTMGDIDIMTKREDFDAACEMLCQDGYSEITSRADAEYGRHRTFVKDRIPIEVHAWFASMNDTIKAKDFDELITRNITEGHVLPDPINGLVLLEHIYQHLEGGIGLRQVIDWMMFVDKCLPDEKWPGFQDVAKKTGLEKLAVAMTRMCEIYLGLPERKWCACAEEKLCGQLMDYILACGNFGNKRTDNGSIIENVFTYARNPKVGFKLLQSRGLVNWSAARRYRFLRPFAWIYQLGRYIFRGIRNDETATKLKEKYKNAKQRIVMFEQLGVK